MLPNRKPHNAAASRSEAIQLVRTSGWRSSQIARARPDGRNEAVRLWLEQEDRDAGRRSDGLTSQNQEERRLRHENRLRREEWEVPKKPRTSS